jgi:hypothetical protein
MSMVFPSRSPGANSPDDLEERIEDALRQLEVLPYRLWSPALRAAFDRLAWASACRLLELHDRGLIEFVRYPDGEVGAVLLDRTLQ